MFNVAGKENPKTRAKVRWAIIKVWIAFTNIHGVLLQPGIETLERFGTDRNSKDGTFLLDFSRMA